MGLREGKGAELVCVWMDAAASCVLRVACKRPEDRPGVARYSPTTSNVRKTLIPNSKFPQPRLALQPPLLRRLAASRQSKLTRKPQTRSTA